MVSDVLYIYYILILIENILEDLKKIALLSQEGFFYYLQLNNRSKTNNFRNGP